MIFIRTNNMHIWHLLFVRACNYAVVDAAISVASHKRGGLCKILFQGCISIDVPE